MSVSASKTFAGRIGILLLLNIESRLNRKKSTVFPDHKNCKTHLSILLGSRQRRRVRFDGKHKYLAVIAKTNCLT